MGHLISNWLRARIAAAMALALALALPGAAWAADPIIIKFSHVVTPDTPKGKGAERFKQLAEERTKGRVKVEVFPNSQLYKDKEEIEALQLGAVQMLAPSLAKFGPLGANNFGVFDLPFLFENRDEVHKITKGKVGRQLLDSLEPKGIKGLAFWDNSFKIVTANKPLRLPSDFQGVKIRIQQSKILEAQMRALGANPQMITFSEAYHALQTGVVDANESEPTNIFTQKHFEVQKYATLSWHGYLGYAVIVNKAFWDGLPADIRTILEGAMAEATDYANDRAAKDTPLSLEGIKASGLTSFVELTPAERDQWKAALLPVHQQMAGRIGKDIINAVYAELGRPPLP